MSEPDAKSIADAFNAFHDRKTWKARPLNTTDGTNAVFFDNVNTMIGLSYSLDDRQWRVRFKKFVAAWGDYIKAIGRSYYQVTNILKSAGLPFDAPISLKGIYVCTRYGEGDNVFISHIREGDFKGRSVAETRIDELLSVQGAVDAMLEGNAFYQQIKDMSEAERKDLLEGKWADDTDDENIMA